MSLSFIAFHMRDYQKDTQQLPLEGHGAYFLLLQHCWTHGHIPADDVSRAAICKVPVQRWRKQLAPLVTNYFDANGENKRATVEIAKAEKLRLRKAMAGHNGGVEAARRKAAKNQAIATATAKLPLQHSYQHSYSGSEAIKREDITSTFSVAARARDGTENFPGKSTSESADLPAGFAEKAREAVKTSATSIGSGELVEVIAKKWLRP